MQIETIRQMTQELKARKPELASRIERAAQILATREVRRIGRDIYQVESQSNPGTFHLVTLGPRSCDCYDFVNNRAPQGFCKHVIAVITMWKAEEEEREERRGQVFAHLVESGIPTMAALQMARG